MGTLWWWLMSTHIGHWYSKTVAVHRWLIWFLPLKLEAGCVNPTAAIKKSQGWLRKGFRVATKKWLGLRQKERCDNSSLNSFQMPSVSACVFYLFFVKLRRQSSRLLPKEPHQHTLEQQCESELVFLPWPCTSQSFSSQFGIVEASMRPLISYLKIT